MDDIARLRLALAATRPGVRRGLTRRVHRDGPVVLHELFEGLEHEQQLAIDRQAEELDRRGVGAVVYGTNAYPPRLSGRANAPAALFYQGPLELLDRPAVGVCGARNVSDQGLRAAGACGELAADQCVVSVSGYARGVDMAVHVASLRAGGATVLVLPEGIDHFHRRDAVAEAWQAGRALVVSQFAPTQTWTAGGAMARNSLIIGLSLAVVVVEAGEKGGTLAAGSHGLDLGHEVWVMRSGRVTAGSRILLDRGAVPIEGRTELAARLAGLRDAAPAAIARGPDPGLFELEAAAR